MLIDGGWWENEAKATIEEMTTKYGDEYANRRFGIMTVPRFEGGSTQKTLYSVTGNSVVLIRKNAKQPDWAIKFLRYTTTDENLRLYTRMTALRAPTTMSLPKRIWSRCRTISVRFGIFSATKTRALCTLTDPVNLRLTTKVISAPPGTGMQLQAQAASLTSL